MPVWAAFLGMVVSAGIAFLSRRSVSTAERSGQAKFIFWDIANRSQDASFFNRKQKFDGARTLFLGVLALIFATYFLEAVGAFD